MPKYATVLISAVLSFASAHSALAQSDTAAQAAIRAALMQWTADFNSRNTQTVCDLFAPDLIADVQGQPPRNHAALCDLLRRSLNDQEKTYVYSPKINEILVSGDLAVVGLVWTLTIKHRDGSPDVTSREPGMDLFQRQPDGRWKITRYMSYEAR